MKVKDESLTYEANNGRSIFRDITRAGNGDFGAIQRLSRHMDEMRVERLGERDARFAPAASGDRQEFDLSSTDAAGGYLVAPLYLQDEFVSYARAGRAVANAIGSRPLPPNTDSINIPTMDGGTTVASQADNASVSKTDATFNTVAADVKTIAGLQDVSQQVVDRSLPGVDQIIFADLAAAYNVTLDVAVINSTVTNNKGLLQVSGINAVTYTDSTPTAGEIYPKVADAIQRIQTNIYMAPSAVFMHPRRWAWLLGSVDTAGRPLITPYTTDLAQIGLQNGVVPEGPAGSIQGLPVYTDSNIPSTLGASTTEDIVIVARTQECFLWEDQGGPYLDTFRDVLSGNLTVRFRLFNYYAQCHARRPKAISTIGGTGVIAPTF